MQLVDWRLAEATGVRLVPPGPRMSLTEATEIVDQLRGLAVEAAAHVEHFTRLDTGEASATIVVVDRPEWIRSNIAGFRSLAEPLIQSIAEKQGINAVSSSSVGGALVPIVGSRIAGAEVGVMLSYLGTRVLGQFELIGPPPAAGDVGVGRLSLVAPNIAQAERSLNVDRHDFRLWVCLHEVTHRTQFAAAPWLHGHVQELLAAYLDAAELEPSALLGRLFGALKGVASVAAGRSDASLVELIQTPKQTEILDRITGLMSLLEGHADFVMDGVGPEVVATVEAIRGKFEGRRTDVNPVERAIRRLLGVEAKMRQYAEGAAFVREVVAAVGIDGLNRVWQSPESLPTGVEIRSPKRWLDRLEGVTAVSA